VGGGDVLCGRTGSETDEKVGETPPGGTQLGRLVKRCLRSGRFPGWGEPRASAGGTPGKESPFVCNGDDGLSEKKGTWCGEDRAGTGRGEGGWLGSQLLLGGGDSGEAALNRGR